MAIRTSARSQYLARQDSPTLIVQPSREILAARSDLAAFGLYVAGKEAQPVHRAWFPYLDTGQDSECLQGIAGEDTNILSFRGSAKTTWLRLWLAKAIGNNPHLQNGWISFTENIAIKSSRWIKRLIESPRYREVFPWVRPGDYWSDRQWQIDWKFAGVSEFDQDFTFAALGITGGITSNRFHLAVFDDLIKSAKAIKNDEIRESMIEVYGEVIEPCLAAVPGSRKISLGTRFRGDDIHSTEFTTENGWKVLQQSAIVKDTDGNERSAWEDRVPLWRLQKLRDRRPVIFAYQWQNTVPDVSLENSITEDDIQYINAGEIPSFAELVLGVDLAASEEERNNATAFVLGGRTRDGLIILLDWEEHRIKGNLKKIQMIMKLWGRWQHKAARLRIVFGKPAYQKSFEGDWEDYRRRYKVMRVTCEGVPENLDKDEKLEAISGVFQDKLVYLNRGKGWGRPVAQLIGADTEEDDIRDGTYFCVSKLQGRIRRKLSGA